MLNKIRLAIRNDLEASAEARAFGTGWISGVAGLILALAGLLLLISAIYPHVFSMKELAKLRQSAFFIYTIQGLLILGFMLGVISMLLRQNRVLGFTTTVVVLMATLIGALNASDNQSSLAPTSILGLDWFVLNLMFTGLLFVPLEKLFGRLNQPLFRAEWREDLFYFLVGSLLVQSLAFLSMAPSMTILQHTENWTNLRQAVAAQPLWLQIIEIMFLTDLVQYWFHRAFHQIPFLWKFHAVHHSAKYMDWLAGSRMHIFEIVGLRAMTIIPMYTLGFAQSALYIYIFFVYLNATFIHANVRFNVEWLKPFIVTPRFHHWHHGIEREAIDVNFSIHFPWIDKLFGTYYMPAKQWPKGYGISGHPVPNGYWKQFRYPFVRK